MPDTPAFLAERLRAEGEKSVQFFQSLSKEALEKIIYTDGAAWNARHVLIHFVTAEISLCKLIENIIAGGSGSPEDFDIDGYNRRKVESYAKTSLEDLIADFRVYRERTASLVSQLAEADLARQGRHPFLGMAALSEIIKIIYRHNQIHQREIRQAIG